MSFGPDLQQERLQRDMSLEAIAESTKVAPRYLRALEEDNYAKLPGGVFNRGIVRSYCRCVGLDEEVWLQRFQAYARAEGEEDWTEFAQNVKRNRESIQARNRLRWLGVAGMVLLLAVAVLAALHFMFGMDFHLHFLHKLATHAAVAWPGQPAPLNG